MYSTLLFLVFLYFSQGYGSSDSLSPFISNRILDGEDAEDGQFPFQVAVQMKNFRQYCGGSILNQYYVLTAAHCIYGNRVKDTTVYSGTINVDIPRRIHYAVEFKIHELYNPYTIVNDIALIKVSPGFKFSSQVAPIQLPAPHEYLPIATTVTVIGWGNEQRTSKSYASNLKKTQIQVADRTWCSSIMRPYGYVVNQNHICAYGYKTGECNGDSGGPLFIGNKVYGIVSWSHKVNGRCAEYPGIFTRVSEYIDWIISHAV